MYSCTQQTDDYIDEMFSKYDDVRERYYREIQDIKNYDLIEHEHHEYMNRVWLAGFGEDADAYEAYWERVLNYYETQPI